MQQAWRVAREDRARTLEWARLLDVPHIVAHLLTRRGIETCEEAKRFLNPSVCHIADPFLLQDMSLAVERIRDARERQERVLVFGDYDVDGVAGTAILLRALRDFGLVHVEYGLPSRFTDGYGLSPDRVEAAHQNGVTLIITVDNGINAREAAAVARQHGINLIVTDHHQLEGDLPEALAIVNPARDPASDPETRISGAAVAFKLAWALTGKKEDLDIVALGTVADVVPLRGENRDFVAAGIEEMRKRPRLGLQALASVARMSLDEVTAENIMFQLGPRLNAAGRLNDAVTSLDLLLTDSPSAANRMAAELNRANQERRDIEQAMFEQAVREVEETLGEGRHSIVLAHKDWHPGVIGIVASKLAGRFNRPTVLIAVGEDGVGRGSGRSAPEFDLVGALGACAQCLERFGGHLAAAGMTIHADTIDSFKEAFEREAAGRSHSDASYSTLDVDGQVSLVEIDGKLVRTLDRLQPFGHGNPAPVFCCYGVEVLPSSVREVRGGHVKFDVRQEGRVASVIAFRMARASVPNGSVDIAFTPQLNTWRGETAVQLSLKDIHAGSLHP